MSNSLYSRIRSVLSPQSLVLLLLPLPLLLVTSGCDAIGYIASAVGGTEMVAPSYKGLASQRCAVMVWADEGVVDDFNTIQLDAARSIQIKLDEAAKAKVDDVSNITWV